MVIDRNHLAVWSRSTWRQRFLTDGLDGLRDAPRPGARRRYGHDEWLKIAALATTAKDPDDPVVTWTYRSSPTPSPAAVSLVAKDDDQGDRELHDSELEGAVHGSAHDVAGGPDREDVAEAAVERPLGRARESAQPKTATKGCWRPDTSDRRSSSRLGAAGRPEAKRSLPARRRRSLCAGVGRRLVPLSGAQGPNEGWVAGLGRRNTNQVTVAKTR